MQSTGFGLALRTLKSQRKLSLESSFLRLNRSFVPETAMEAKAVFGTSKLVLADSLASGAEAIWKQYGSYIFVLLIAICI
jgi:hypothetical protein